MHARYLRPHIIWSVFRGIRYIVCYWQLPCPPAHAHLMCTCTRTSLVYTMAGDYVQSGSRLDQGHKTSLALPPSRGTVTSDKRIPSPSPTPVDPQTCPPSCSPDLSTTASAFMFVFVLVLTALDRTIHVTPIDVLSAQNISLPSIYIPLPLPETVTPTSTPPAPARYMPLDGLQLLQCKRAICSSARLYHPNAYFSTQPAWIMPLASSSVTSIGANIVMSASR